MSVSLYGAALAEEAASDGESAGEPAPAAVITCSPEEIDYANVPFDYSDQIAAEEEGTVLVPEAAAIALTVTDEIGITGVKLVGSLEEGNESEYYLNAYAAEDPLTFTAQEGTEIVSADSSISGSLEVADGSVVYSPAELNAKELVDEVIAFHMADGSKYSVHTVPEAFPALEVTGEGTAEEQAGVYTFVLDKFLLRADTQGRILYYRDVNCVGEVQAENFAPQTFAGSQYYSLFVELRPEYRNANGGFSSGMYLVMNDRFQDIDLITLYPNEDPDHTHGEGYLDQHEFVIIDETHYLLLSYTLQQVENLPESLEGLDGTQSAYVWAGIMQEVKDDEVIAEINTADYPLLYESAVEKIDYANSTLDGVMVTVGQNEISSFADGIMDYVHVNSLDYTLNEEGTVDKLLVSMRDQSAVFQFDMKSGAIDWILGGKASTLAGYEEFTTDRTDDMGAGFKALTFGQHFARYCNRTEAGTLDGNPVISVFDNQTGMAPFLMAMPIPTLTRVFKAEIDEVAKTATILDVVDGAYLNEKTGKYHIASHCGSVQYNNSTVMIGWGLHGVVDNIGPFAPKGTISDLGFEDLRIGSRPVFTDYDMENDTVLFELSGNRNPKEENAEAFFSYRTYKTAE
ncbi:MAG: aryl-sulfate sulfotransferase [Parasporobacterium sp.]|nr:aryl-sulfate sulfotransferase [Parasporobacterium sp.]